MHVKGCRGSEVDDPHLSPGGRSRPRCVRVSRRHASEWSPLLGVAWGRNWANFIGRLMQCWETRADRMMSSYSAYWNLTELRVVSELPLRIDQYYRQEGKTEKESCLQLQQVFNLAPKCNGIATRSPAPILRRTCWQAEKKQFSYTRNEW